MINRQFIAPFTVLSAESITIYDAMTETAGKYQVDNTEASLNAAVELNRLKPGSVYKTWLKNVQGIVSGEQFAIALVNEDKPDTGLLVNADRDWAAWALPHRDMREIAFYDADEFLPIACTRIAEFASLNKTEIDAASGG